LEPIYVQVA